MKVVLCYGDSNTWGYKPATGERYARDVRWPGVARCRLGDDYVIIEEGLNGRTTVWDDPIEGFKNGRDYLIPCLDSHCPIDIVTIMLGTNDLKKRFSLSAYDIAAGVSVLVDIVQRSAAGPGGAAPQVLLMAPPPFAKLSESAAEMFEGAPEKALKLAASYAQVAADRNCHFLNAGDIIRSSELDGFHLEADQHALLGEAVAARVMQFFNG
jgi:lysophospholipase L1-like esterase